MNREAAKIATICIGYVLAALLLLIGAAALLAYLFAEKAVVIIFVVCIVAILGYTWWKVYESEADGR